MTFKGWTVAAGLVLLAPCAPHAATEANFGAATTADLVNLCDELDVFQRIAINQQQICEGALSSTTPSLPGLLVAQGASSVWLALNAGMHTHATTSESVRVSRGLRRPPTTYRAGPRWFG